MLHSVPKNYNLQFTFFLSLTFSFLQFTNAFVNCKIFQVYNIYKRIQMTSSVNYFTQIQMPTIQEASITLDAAETPEVFHQFGREIVKILIETPIELKKMIF